MHKYKHGKLQGALHVDGLRRFDCIRNQIKRDAWIAGAPVADTGPKLRPDLALYGAPFKGSYPYGPEQA